MTPAMGFSDFSDRFFRGEFADPATWPGTIFYGLVFFIAALIASHGLRLTVNHVLERHGGADIDLTSVTFFAQVARVGIYLAAAVLYAGLVPALHSLGTALLAGVSIASIVVGLAAQTTLGNLVAGFAVVLYKPFRVGDRLRVGAPGGVEMGRVERLTLGYTILRGDDGRAIVVPNSVMASQITVNLGRHDRHIEARRDVPDV
jgi:small-conductance mechanosensitive channel